MSKSLFTLLRELVTRKNNADGTPALDAAGKPIEEKTVEKISLDGDTEVEVGGKKIRLNELGSAYLERGTVSPDAEITIAAADGLPEVKTKVTDLCTAFHTLRKNTADALKSEEQKAEAQKKETARLNALTEEERQKEIERKNSFNITLRNAAGRGTSVNHYSTTSGSLAEKVAEGKKRY